MIIASSVVGGKVMARPKRAKTTKEQIEQAEEFVLKTKAAYDEAVKTLKELREKEEKENQEVQIILYKNVQLHIE